jgi:hypothetical protein
MNINVYPFFKLAQSINGYIADVRAAKHPFQLGAVLTIVREIATATMSRKDATSPSWNDVSESIAQLMHDGGVVLPLALDTDNVVKSILTPLYPLPLNAHIFHKLQESLRGFIA